MNLFGLRRLGCVVLSFVLWVAVICGSSGDDDTLLSVDMGAGESPVLYIGLMIHLEAHPSTTRTEHEAYRDEIMNYAELFDEFEAKPTWEAKEPIVDCIRYNDPYLKVLENRGHGVGVHADLGGNPEVDLTQEQMASELAEKRIELAWQGVSVRHVSGICSHLDWVHAAMDAGYEFVTGVVDYCAQSISPVPEAYAHCTSAGECHDPYGSTMADRMHPWRARTSNWTQPDPDGDLIILPSATVGLPHLEPDTGVARLTMGDVNQYMINLEEALTLVEPGQVNTFFLLWSYGPALNPAVMREWLTRIEPYVAEGKVAWKTLPEMVDTYLAWELLQQKITSVSVQGNGVVTIEWRDAGLNYTVEETTTLLLPAWSSVMGSWPEGTNMWSGNAATGDAARYFRVVGQE